MCSIAAGASSDMARLPERQMDDVSGAGLAGSPGRSVEASEDPARHCDIYAFNRVIKQGRVHGNNAEYPSSIIGIVPNNFQARRRGNGFTRIQGSINPGSRGFFSTSKRFVQRVPSRKAAGKIGKGDTKRGGLGAGFNRDGITRDLPSYRPAFRIAATSPLPRSFLGWGMTTEPGRSGCLKT